MKERTNLLGIQLHVQLVVVHDGGQGLLQRLHQVQSAALSSVPQHNETLSLKRNACVVRGGAGNRFSVLGIGRDEARHECGATEEVAWVLTPLELRVHDTLHTHHKRTKRASCCQGQRETESWLRTETTESRRASSVPRQRSEKSEKVIVSTRLSPCARIQCHNKERKATKERRKGCSRVKWRTSVSEMKRTTRDRYCG